MKIAYYDIIDGKSVPVSMEEAKKRDEKWMGENKLYLEEMEKSAKADDVWLIIEKSNISKENKEKLYKYIYAKEE